MVMGEAKCEHDGCDCLTTNEFCSDFCLSHGAVSMRTSTRKAAMGAAAATPSAGARI